MKMKNHIMHPPSYAYLLISSFMIAPFWCSFFFDNFLSFVLDNVLFFVLLVDYIRSLMSHCRHARSCSWWNLSKHVGLQSPIFLLQRWTRHVEQYVVVWLTVTLSLLISATALQTMHIGGCFLNFFPISSPPSSTFSVSLENLLAFSQYW